MHRGDLRLVALDPDGWKGSDWSDASLLCHAWSLAPFLDPAAAPGIKEGRQIAFTDATVGPTLTLPTSKRARVEPEPHRQWRHP